MIAALATPQSLLNRWKVLEWVKGVGRRVLTPPQAGIRWRADVSPALGLAGMTSNPSAPARADSSLEISSSNFPRFDRNPNTGHEFGVDAELAKAEQTIFHDREHPSHVLLPIIPR